jgi:hypothetical protein
MSQEKSLLRIESRWDFRAKKELGGESISSDALWWPFFQLYLPNTSIQENSSIPLVIKTLLIAYILPYVAS